MINNISRTDNKGFIPIPSTNPAQLPTGEESFKGEVSRFINEVNDSMLQAQDASLKLARGESKNVHEALISMEKSNIALQFTAQVRNRALEAYQEIMRLQM
jgi:flagellar hook-basal body complex protein FliE